MITGNSWKKYAVWGETLSLDTDSFDYLPYDYSRRMYENLLLLRLWNIRKCGDYGNLSLPLIRLAPVLESGPSVLVGNLGIFRERENFFEHMNIHILQCDCVIQEHVRITCQEEWQEYVDHMEVKGHGDTDFTPVFRLVDEMVREGTDKFKRTFVFYGWGWNLSGLDSFL